MTTTPDPKTVHGGAKYPDTARGRVRAFLDTFERDSANDLTFSGVIAANLTPDDPVLTVEDLRGLLTENVQLERKLSWPDEQPRDERDARIAELEREVRQLRAGAPRAWKQDWHDPIARFETFVNVTRSYDSDRLGGIMRGGNAEATITLGDLRAVLARLAELEAAQDERDGDVRPGHGPGVPGAMHLEAFGQSIADAFGHCPYHVGSSATSKNWRDVDVRLILDDDRFHALFPGFAAANHIDAWWSLLCAALSELGRARTGLPIDFQIQSMTEANEKYSGIRNPLFLIHARDEHQLTMAALDARDTKAPGQQHKPTDPDDHRPYTMADYRDQLGGGRRPRGPQQPEDGDRG